MPSGRNQPSIMGFCVFFKRSTDETFFDLGPIEELTPSFEVEEATQEDGRTGRRVVIHKQVTSFGLQYEVTATSANMNNMAISLGAAGAEPLVQVAAKTTQTIAGGTIPSGGIFQVTDGTDNVFAARIAGVYATGGSVTAVANDLTAVDASAGTLTLATATPAVGSQVVVTEGLNVGTYTVTAFGAGVATVAETLTVDESTVTWDITTAAAGVFLTHGTDYTYDQDLGDGLVKLSGTAACVTAVAAGLEVLAYTKSLTGNRRIRPLTNNESTAGTVVILAVAEEGGVAWRAEHQVTLVPQSPTFSQTESSRFPYTLTVTYDSSAANPGGTFDKIRGALALGV